MRNNALRRAAHRRGMVEILFAVMGLMLIGFLGLAVDTGYMVHTGNQLQGVADAAALAGAQALTTGTYQARDAAVQTAAANTAGGVSITLSRNDANATTGDIVLGAYSRASQVFDTGGIPNAVRVTARRTSAENGSVGLFFGGIFGAGSADMTRTSTAMLDAASAPGLVVLNATASAAVSVSGGAQLVVSNGGIQVDSNHPHALTVTGSGVVLSVEDINIVGGLYLTGGGTCTPAPHTGAAYISDPYASLPAPQFSSGQAGISLTHSASATISAGYYTGGISVIGAAALTMNPGVYILGGTGLRIGNSAIVVAHNVFIYFTGTGKLDITGNPTVEIDPMDTGDYAGITMFQDRADTQPATIANSGSMPTSGLLYFPRSTLTISGGASGLAVGVCVDKLVCQGSGKITLSGPGGSSRHVYLVK